jgi:hypothetical protein
MLIKDRNKARSLDCNWCWSSKRKGVLELWLLKVLFRRFAESKLAAF